MVTDPTLARRKTKIRADFPEKLWVITCPDCGAGHLAPSSWRCRIWVRQHTAEKHPPQS